MEEDYKHIGRIMKAARRFKKENQESVSKAIGCSQSALSKLEHGTLVPSAPQWFDFCRYLEIPVQSLESGVIDRNWPLSSLEEPSIIKWPKRYRMFRGVKSRELYPFVSYLGQVRGDEGVQKMFEELGIDIDLAVDFDHQINHVLIFDIIHYFIKNDIINIQNMKALGERNASPIMHGELFKHYSKLKNVKDLLSSFSENQRFYQIDVKFEVESELDKCVLILKTEKQFDYFLKEAGPDVVDFYRYYLKSKLECFLSALLKSSVNLSQVQALAPQGIPERYEVIIKD
jgi:transcriptional regulator with XRE-family HTH domain